MTSISHNLYRNWKIEMHTIYKFRFTSSALQVQSYKLSFTRLALQVQIYKLSFSSPDLQVELTCSKFVLQVFKLIIDRLKFAGKNFTCCSLQVDNFKLKITNGYLPMEILHVQNKSYKSFAFSITVLKPLTLKV